MSWQPIETAPRDGTAILVHGVAPKFAGTLLNSPYDRNAHPTIAVVAYYRHEYETFEDAGNGLFCKVIRAHEGWRGLPGIIPTHWQPLPEPPEKAA